MVVVVAAVSSPVLEFLLGFDAMLKYDLCIPWTWEILWVHLFESLARIRCPAFAIEDAGLMLD